MENITATKGDLQQTNLAKRAKEELQKSFVKGLVANKFLDKGNKAWER